MRFEGVSREFSLVGERQYETNVYFIFIFKMEITD